MKQITINGGNLLSGTINISGAKNSAVALVPASLLSDEEVESNRKIFCISMCTPRSYERVLGYFIDPSDVTSTEVSHRESHAGYRQDRRRYARR